jgi:hypothetical protein
LLLQQVAVACTTLCVLLLGWVVAANSSTIGCELLLWARPNRVASCAAGCRLVLWQHRCGSCAHRRDRRNNSGGCWWRGIWAQQVRYTAAGGISWYELLLLLLLLLEYTVGCCLRWQSRWHCCIG